MTMLYGMSLHTVLRFVVYSSQCLCAYVLCALCGQAWGRADGGATQSAALFLRDGHALAELCDTESDALRTITSLHHVRRAVHLWANAAIRLLGKATGDLAELAHAVSTDGDAPGVGRTERGSVYAGTDTICEQLWRPTITRKLLECAQHLIPVAVRAKPTAGAVLFPLVLGESADLRTARLSVPRGE